MTTQCIYIKIFIYNDSVWTYINDNNQCNSRIKSECPLDGHCLMNNVIYQATVVTDTSTETYIGLTENHFKTRYRNHLASFKDKNKKNKRKQLKLRMKVENSGTSKSVFKYEQKM